MRRLEAVYTELLSTVPSAAPQKKREPSFKFVAQTNHFAAPPWRLRECWLTKVRACLERACMGTAALSPSPS
jgi:hypothetical protein